MSATKKSESKFLVFSKYDRNFPHQTTHRNIPCYLEGKKNKKLISYQLNNKDTIIFNFPQQARQQSRARSLYESDKTSQFIQSNTKRVIIPSEEKIPATPTKISIRYDVNKETEQKDRKPLLKRSAMKERECYHQTNIPVGVLKVQNILDDNQQKNPSKSFQKSTSLKIMYDQYSKITTLPGTLKTITNDLKEIELNRRAFDIVKSRFTFNTSEQTLNHGGGSAKKLFPQTTKIRQESNQQVQLIDYGVKKNRDRENIFYRQTTEIPNPPITERQHSKGRVNGRDAFKSQIQLF